MDDDVTIVAPTRWHVAEATIARANERVARSGSLTSGTRAGLIDPRSL